jgi:hypothetical protein
MLILKANKTTAIIRAGIFGLLFLYVLQSEGQTFPLWTEPVTVTDSISDNINPDLQMAYAVDYQRMMFMVWEKVIDSQTTAIYYRDILSSGDPQVIMQTPGVRYTHPKISDAPITHFMPPQDTLFYIFFESNQNGNSDIYYIKYLQGGEIIGPFPFAATASEETNFTIQLAGIGEEEGLEPHIINAMAWTRDGELVTSYIDKVSSEQFQFTEPEVVDQGLCSSPLMFSFNRIYWIRETVEGSFVYFSERDSSRPSGWLEPVLFFDGGNCSDLMADKLVSKVFTWTCEIGVTWYIYVASFYDLFDPFPLDILQDAPFDQAIGQYAITNDASKTEFGPWMIAFPSDEGGDQEMYLNEDPWMQAFNNFSMSATDNRNPDFFRGEDIEPTVFHYAYLVWESLRNGHWQIFASKTVRTLVGVEEGPELNSVLRVNPNPFSEKVTISVDLASGLNADIEVITPWGHKIRSLFTGYRESGKQSVTWDGRDDSANSVPPGIYFIRAIIEDKSYTVKVLKGL